MKKRKKKCILCGKEINTYKEYFLKGIKKRPSGGSSYAVFSEEGVLFNTNKRCGVWFCNSCWGEILKYKK